MAMFTWGITRITISMTDYEIERYPELVRFGRDLYRVVPLSDIATASYDSDLGTLTLTFKRPLTDEQLRKIRREIEGS